MHFFRYLPDIKRYEYVRSWTCNEIRNTRIVGLASHEVDKTDVQLAVAAKSLHIVHLNVWKHVYVKAAKMQELKHQQMAILDDDQDRLPYETVGKGCHQAGITHMDISI